MRRGGIYLDMTECMCDHKEKGYLFGHDKVYV